VCTRGGHPLIPRELHPGDPRLLQGRVHLYGPHHLYPQEIPHGVVLLGHHASHVDNGWKMVLLGTKVHVC
jgi:hypothetical protein